MKLKDITPKQYHCSLVACPSVFSIQDNPDKVIIVGKKVNVKESNLKQKVGDDEEAVMVDKEMLQKLFYKDSSD